MDLPASVIALLKEGGTTAVAILALFMLDRVWRYVLEREKAYAAEIREDKAVLLKVLSDNTTALTRLSGSVENWTKDNEHLHGKTSN